MSHVHHTGFELGTGKCLVANGQGIDAFTAYSYGRSYRINAGEYVEKDCNHATIFTGFRSYIIAYEQDFLRFYGDNGATLHGYVRHGSDGFVRLYKGDGTLLATSVDMHPWSVWNFWESKFVLHDSAGAFEIKKDGDVICSVTGVDTKNGGQSSVISRVRVGSTASHGHYVDDWWINDGAGAAPDNDYYGDIRIQTLVPVGAGDITGLTPSTAPNWECVNEALNAAPSAADYCGSPTPGTKDLYNITDLVGVIPSIKGLSVNVFAGKSDAGSISGRRLIKTGGTEFQGPDLTLAATHQLFTENFVTNPDTGLSWTKANVNALQPGYEVRA